MSRNLNLFVSLIRSLYIYTRVLYMRAYIIVRSCGDMSPLMR